MLAILGVTDEQTTCDICGKTHLRSTVILHDLEQPYVEVGRYGSTCAGRMLGGAKGVLKTARTVEMVRRSLFFEILGEARKLKATGELEAMMRPASEAKRFALHPDEIAAVAKLFQV